jgi:glycosyltransferase involved in cell wall biosynthesis
MSNLVIFKQPVVTGMVSIIIPVRADAEGLSITLNSIKHTVPAGQPYEVVVANDGGDPAISALCADESHIAECILIPNRGPGGARNEALTYAQGEYIAFLDADVQVQPGWWKALLSALQQHDYAAGRVDINPDLIRNFFHKYDQISAFNVKQYMQNHHGATANVAVRRSLLETIGAFDARFRSGEDTEFGIRAYETGQRMVYADAMLVYHPPRGFSEQRRKIYRVVVGHAQLRETFPQRFHKYAITPRMVAAFLLPPRKLAKEPELMKDVGTLQRIGLYLTRYAARLYQLCCYVAMQFSSPAQKKHDLS